MSEHLFSVTLVRYIIRNSACKLLQDTVSGSQPFEHSCKVTAFDVAIVFAIAVPIASQPNLEASFVKLRRFVAHPGSNLSYLGAI